MWAEVGVSERRREGLHLELLGASAPAPARLPSFLPSFASSLASWLPLARPSPAQKIDRTFGLAIDVGRTKIQRGGGAVRALRFFVKFLSIF